MVQPFPVRESSILSLSELLSRLLGLLFLARFVAKLGLHESAEFRMLLPLIGIAATLGSIGLPQALTRLFASAVLDAGRPVPHSLLRAALWGTLCAAGFALLTMLLLSLLAVQDGIFKSEFARLLEAAVPLLLLMCATGSLRGMLLGLGSTYAPACAQVVEVGVRLGALLLLLPDAAAAHLPAAEVGILTLTAGEGLAGLFLGAVLWREVAKRGVVRDRASGALFSVLRMSLAPTGQSLLATLGYALELPLAHELLSRTHGAAAASQLIAEYASIALPLLCAPMVLTDGIATAHLPLASAERAASGGQAFAVHLRRVLGAVMMVALPATGMALVLAPTLAGWFHAPEAALMLLLLAPAALPLYLQAPLSALLQAQGRSRALLYAGLLGDLVRLGMILAAFGLWQAGRAGFALAFAASALVQTGSLLWMLRRYSTLVMPWRTLYRSVQAALAAVALLLVALHAPLPYSYSFSAQPIAWGAGALLLAGWILLYAEEITPQTLSRLPLLGILFDTRRKTRG
ncbi:O-antigen/teichoic acid export membrane protein [Tumebacillus sp. BK434]|uniref:oligosaccharide flippase family protein n=1 Tax=Tumebacillus sp. BK434 TaxID=2512169 RepID=UPI0010E74B34|nr:polysaccharide biosynthesis C-terminal domain-containing protein [Tumebacillus sp. BK434]TCP55620.1 O-antigen/teichoic acid export membrane protein [Tumebacillus sp. BK434]